MKHECDKIKQFKVKLVDLWGNYYYKELTSQEFEERWNHICVEVPYINTKEQLEDFLRTEVMDMNMNLRDHGP